MSERDSVQLRQSDGDVLLGVGRVPGLQFVGLCHGVQTTMDLIGSYVGVPKEEIHFVAAGINHMAWLLKLEHQGKKLIPAPIYENFLWDYVDDKLLHFESADFKDERRFFDFLSAKSASSADKTNALFVKCIIPTFCRLARSRHVF